MYSSETEGIRPPREPLPLLHESAFASRFHFDAASPAILNPIPQP
ncbi:hypothetical protein B8V81_3281 [Paenibacillus pasadenensis]|uniref:Uncharacterized protein n=1 Tax=Paenibacillus pasadenensis TaxID=217090 RepID=A0A2N5N3G1_9BACL|nr:hypothetical protein B8V81_3281 [Paenibacillus pasadenensis]